MNHVARADDIQQILRIVGMRRIFHRIEVIEIAEEFVEAVHGRQEFVPVAEMVLAELAGGVAHRLEHGRDGHRLGGNADRRAGLTDRGHAGADRQFAGDEVRAARRAARLGVIVGEQHAFFGDLVEVRRSPGHHAAMIGADVPHADVIAHDDDDVWFFLLRDGARDRRGQSDSGRNYSRRPAKNFAPHRVSSLYRSFKTRDKLSVN